MSLLLRRRVLGKIVEDLEDGKYCYAAGISASYSNAVPWLYKSTDYGATFRIGLPITPGYNRTFTGLMNGQWFSRLAINNERVSLISGSSCRYWIHEEEPYTLGVYQTNSSSVHVFGSNWSNRKNFCMSTGSDIGQAEPQITYFGSRSGSSAIERVVGRYIIGSDSSWQSYSSSYKRSPSASVCSRDGKYAVIGTSETQLMAGGNGTVFTTDSGTTWQVVTLATSESNDYEGATNDACMSADGRVTVLATTKGLVYSNDYMQSWHLLSQSGMGTVRSCCIKANGRKAWATFFRSSKDCGINSIDFSLEEPEIQSMRNSISFQRIRCNAAGTKFIGIRSGSSANGDRIVYSNSDISETPAEIWSESVFYGDGVTPNTYAARCFDVVMSYSK